MLARVRNMALRQRAGILNKDISKGGRNPEERDLEGRDLAYPWSSALRAALRSAAPFGWLEKKAPFRLKS
jgi:hypothetical protein